MRNQPPSSRRAAASPAKLMMPDGSAVACVIVNLSSGGARIDVAADAAVSHDFHLASEELNIATQAQLAWRIGAQLGVRFAARQHVPRPRVEWVATASSREPASCLADRA